MTLLEKKKCYLYIRVSTTMQIDGFSLEAQQSTLEAYAATNNLKVVRCYQDAGKSGKSLVGRDDFNQMLEDIKNKKDGVSFVLVYKLSRFGRNVRDVQNSLYLLQKNNVELVCVADGLNTSNSIGKLLISIMGAIAEMEAENISQQTMAGRKQKAKNGLWNGGQAPFGYYLDNGMLTVCEEEAAIVQKIFDLYTEEAYGIVGIVKYLNEHGYKKSTQGNNKLDYFTKKLVSDILTNPVYCGDIAYGRRHLLPIDGDHPDERRKVVTQENYITAEGKHTAIVSRPQFEEAQKRKVSMSRMCQKREDNDHVHLLATILRCPVCGEKMYGNTTRKKRKDGSGEYYAHYHFYGCKHRRNVEGTPCNFKSNILEEKIDQPVVDVLCKLATNQTLANKIAARVGSVTDESESITAIQEIQKLIDKKRATARSATARLALFDDSVPYASEVITDIRDTINRLYQEMEALEKDLAGEKEKLAAIRENKLTTGQIYEILEKFKDLYEIMSPGDRQLLIRTLVKEVHIYDTVQPGNKLIKKIVLNIPIGYDGDTPYVTIDQNAASLDEKTVDETVVLMSRIEK